jgi:dihydrofolate synthase/folylpolyglutamate synthase
MKYQEAMDYIEGCAGYGIVPGLDSIRELLRRLEHPEKKLKFIHIAGTNGKGSVLAFVSQALTANGYRVGRYISPTILEYRERFQIQGKPVSQAMVAHLMEIVSIQADAMAEEGFAHPTPFEIETAMAFILFVEKQCDLVVLETGMGGELDATNVVEDTLVSVITPISMDHQAFLGDTLEKIAEQKAGIIKPGAVVVSAPQEEEVSRVLVRKAKEKQARELIFVDEEEIKNRHYGIRKQSFSYGGFSDVEISLAGQVQLVNGAVALQVLSCLARLGYPLKEEKIRRGMKETVWPGRFQIVQKNPLFIVDGAHNPAAAVELRKSLQFYFTNKQIIYIMGVFRDKDYRKVIETTWDLAEHIITVAAKGNPRALPALELAGEISRYHSRVTAADSVEEAVELSCLLADKDTVIVAFGSFSFLGDCIRALEQKNKVEKKKNGR